jgi:hypothetical protein
MLGPTLIRNEVIEVREPRQKRLLAPIWMMKPFHGEQFPRDGVVGLIEQGAGHRPLRVGKHRIPACLLVLEPAPHPLAIGLPCHSGDIIGNVVEPLTQRKHAQALALARPGQHGVQRRAQGLADRGRDGRSFLRELGECVAQAVAEACPRV